MPKKGYQGRTIRVSCSTGCGRGATLYNLLPDEIDPRTRLPKVNTAVCWYCRTGRKAKESTVMLDIPREVTEEIRIKIKAQVRIIGKEEANAMLEKGEVTPIDKVRKAGTLMPPNTMWQVGVWALTR